MGLERRAASMASSLLAGVSIGAAAHAARRTRSANVTLLGLTLCCLLGVSLASPRVAVADRTVFDASKLNTSSSSYAGWHPKVSDGYVVWAIYLGGDQSEFHFYDLRTSSELPTLRTANNGGGWDFDQGKLVWTDKTKGEADLDIRMYDLASGLQQVVCAAPQQQFSPRIHGNRIVWTDRRGAEEAVYLLDISAGVERRLSSNVFYSAGSPAISGNRVVWLDGRDSRGNPISGAPGSMWSYDLGSGQEAYACDMKGGVFEGGLEIDGDLVTWCEISLPGYPAGSAPLLGRGVCAFDFATGRTSVITATPFDSPSVTGSRIQYVQNGVPWSYDAAGRTWQWLDMVPSPGDSMWLGAVGDGTFVCQTSQTRTGLADVYLLTPRTISDAPATSDSKPTVVLVGGLGSSTQESDWGPLAGSLISAGYPVAFAKSAPGAGGPDTIDSTGPFTNAAARRLDRFLSTGRTFYNQPIGSRVILVGHSMGGVDRSLLCSRLGEWGLLKRAQANCDCPAGTTQWRLAASGD